MRPVQLEDPDVVLTAPPGMPECGDLHAKIETEDGFHFISAWRPSDEERAAIADGANVELRVWGDAHPPVSLDVADA